ncbi:MAG: SseB family protein [Myxococcota bacterium]
MDAQPDRALIAFRRLLAEGAEGGQGKVDALVALAQRTVLVPTWTEGGDDFRPLISSDGKNALPLFSAPDELEEAARRYGWVAADGSVPHREIGSRAAFRHALAHQLHFVIIDIAADHALEVERSEIEPLLRSQNRSDSSGAFAGVGRISEQMLKKVRPSSVPAAPNEFQTVSVPTDAPVPAKPDESPPAPIEISEPPSDPLLDAASKVLRSYPEVEWAAYFVSQGGAQHVGLRIDGAFRTRVTEIVGALLACGTEHSVPLRVSLLDEADLVRAVRERGVAFYPWRRRN